MPFCASWNPHADSPHKPDYCKPGRCSKCWSACWHRVDVKGTRCADCTRALVRHPDPAMRMLLVNEPGVGNDVLQALSTDADASVMLAANLLLVDRGQTRVEVVVPREYVNSVHYLLAAGSSI